MTTKRFEHQFIRVPMVDGTVWDVPVLHVALDRARYYAHEYGGSVETSLAEDTGPLFTDDEYEILEWAQNNMNWRDVEAVAIPAPPQPPVDEATRAKRYQEAWMNTELKVVTHG